MADDGMVGYIVNRVKKKNLTQQNFLNSQVETFITFRRVYHIVAYHQVGVYHIVAYHEPYFIEKRASGICRVRKLY